MSPHQFEIFDVGEVTVVRFFTSMKNPDSQMCVEIASVIQDRLTWLIEEMGRRYFVINLEKVDFYFGSESLGKLFGLFRLVRPIQGKVVFGGLRSQMLDVFTIVGFNKIFGVASTEEEGLRLFENPSG